jgi:hypothetical protein
VGRHPVVQICEKRLLVLRIASEIEYALVVCGGMVYDSLGIEVMVMLEEEVPMVDHR